ncbi:alpha/beta fold hydrolase [Sphingomonas sp. RB1R13]|uniref:alpha/beta fold hydrolase n=1 Tax=Sphingomonas sp. RB1R13 TaxID=3096159 RepID=UPI002FCC9CA1
MAKLSTSLGIIGVDEQGSDGVPLVFLHGVGSDRSAWAPQLAHFGMARRTIAFDHPGYGESDPARPSDEAPHDRFAAAILAALDALEIGQAHICGLSLGGVVAIALAALAPGRVASLIIADSFLAHPDGPAIVERSVAASCDMAALARARVPVLLGAGADPSLVAELEQVMAQIDPAAFRLASRAVWAADQRERATAISVPTLVICGSEDRVTPPALSEAVTSAIDRARLVMIQAAGHLPNLEQAALFNFALDRFLSEPAPDSTGLPAA